MIVALATFFRARFFQKGAVGMVEGSDEYLQLESLLARFILINSRN